MDRGGAAPRVKAGGQAGLFGDSVWEEKELRLLCIWGSWSLGHLEAVLPHHSANEEPGPVLRASGRSAPRVALCTSSVPASGAQTRVAFPALPAGDGKDLRVWPPGHRMLSSRKCHLLTGQYRLSPRA